MVKIKKNGFLDRVVDWCLENRLLVLLLVFLYIIYSLTHLNDFAVDAVPDITNTQVVVNTKTLGLDPEKVELMVTFPIENELMGIPDLVDMRSISKVGLSQITLVFKDGTNIYWARQQVAEKLPIISSQLPLGITPELAPITTGLGEVFMYALLLKQDSVEKTTSEEETLRYLREVQDFVIKPQLRRIKDVAEIDSNGGYKKQLHINLLPEKIIQYGLTIEKIENRLSGIGESFGAGLIDVNNESLIIRSNLSLASIEQVKNLSLAQTYNGRDLKIKDIADVSFDSAPRIGAASINGSETVLGTVLMKSGGNGRKLCLEIERAISELNLPEDVELKVLYNRSYLVNATLQTVIKNLIEGALLVILILIFVLGNFRASLIVASVIPLSMLGTTVGMQFLGISGNLMSLGAIDFGLVVDGAVVMIETMVSVLFTQSSNQHKYKDNLEMISELCKSIVRPIFFGVLMIMLVYVPIFLLGGVSGKMFKPMAMTVLMTLGIALVLTFTLVPVLAYYFLKAPAHADNHDHETKIFKMIRLKFTPLLNNCLAHPKIVLGATGSVFLLVILLFSQLGSEFTPQLDEGDLVVNFSRNPKISLQESVREQLVIENMIKNEPEVEFVFSRLGTPESATDPMGVHLADTFIILKKELKGSLAKIKSDLYQRLKKKIETLNFEHEISSTQPIEMRFNEMLEGSRADISLRLSGTDLNYMLQEIENLSAKILTIKGIESAESDPLTALKKSQMLEITPDYAALAKLEIPLQDFYSTVSGFMNGIMIGQWITKDRKFPIMIHLAESRRNNLDQIKKLPVMLSAGGSVPLESIAHLGITEQVTTIARHWGKRYAAVSINLENRDTMSVVADLNELFKKLTLKEGHHLSLGGQFKNLLEAKKKLYIIIPLTIIIIFFILYFEFKSQLEALLILLCVPLATIGGVLALWMRDINFSLSAAVGFIALIGIALLNGIVLMTVFMQNKNLSNEITLRESIIHSTLQRLRPVIMTALVAAIGFLPMALNSGLGAEVQKPLASVVIGGIFSSTILTLFLLPTIYYFIFKKRISRSTSKQGHLTSLI